MSTKLTTRTLSKNSQSSTGAHKNAREEIKERPRGAHKNAGEVEKTRTKNPREEHTRTYPNEMSFFVF
jgi:hypothetical protein